MRNISKVFQSEANKYFESKLDWILPWVALGLSFGGSEIQKDYSTLFDYGNMNEMFVFIKIYTLDSA
jgi:hypothetical protein